MPKKVRGSQSVQPFALELKKDCVQPFADANAAAD
eukprot:gene13597-2514_t